MRRKGTGCENQIFILKHIGEKAQEKKRFIYLEKAYDRVNREPLWLVLRMYDVDGKLLGGIRSMYADSLACVKVK